MPTHRYKHTGTTQSCILAISLSNPQKRRPGVISYWLPCMINKYQDLKFQRCVRLFYWGSTRGVHKGGPQGGSTKGVHKGGSTFCLLPCSHTALQTFDAFFLQVSHLGGEIAEKSPLILFHNSPIVILYRHITPACVFECLVT